jgi:signal transduction histidine kinase
MTTKARYSSPADRPTSALFSAVGALALVPQRVREGRFWVTQALVLGAVSAHYGVEYFGVTNPVETFNGIAITLYFVPMLYASLAYGWEGAILTALWGALLSTPSLWVWHRSELHWLSEMAQLLVTLPVGMIVAWRVDREKRLRVEAQATSSSLGLINNVGTELQKAFDVERHLPEVLSALTAHVGFDASWVALAEDVQPYRLIVSPESFASSVPDLELISAGLHYRVVEDLEEYAQEGAFVAVPLRSKSGALGSLGCHIHSDEGMDGRRVELLKTVASQVGASLENARLYRQRQQSLRIYARQVTQAQEDERLRIARELHDDTAQELVHLVRNIERIPESSPAEIGSTAESVAELARDILQSVRRYARNMRPSVLDDLGLVAAIEMIVVETDERIPTSVTLAVSGDERRRDPSVELALFRIAQEALRNVEKHAKAKSAQVNLCFNGEQTAIEIRDDGIGFELPVRLHENANIGELGLLGMAERAELVGGTFELRSSPEGSGTIVRASV